MTAPTIVLAGASGDLGNRILSALVARGASVRALIRHDAPATDASRPERLGAKIARADAHDVSSTAAACEGASCIVSALNGLRDVIVERQGILLDAAVAAGVPRFIPSDYAADFMKTAPGRNRNFDFRREVMHRAERAPVALTSVLNGAFMDMLGAEMPIVQARVRRASLG